MAKPDEHIRTEMVRARVTAAQRAAYVQAAGREPLSDWVRRVLDEAAGVKKQIGRIDSMPPAVRGLPHPLTQPVSEPQPIVRVKDPTTPDPLRTGRCEQWRNHRAGRFCKTCGETIPV